MPTREFTIVEVTVHYFCDECSEKMWVCGETLTNEGLLFTYGCNNGHWHSDSIRYPRIEKREIPFQ